MIVAPLLAACVVAITRIQDHRHHTEGKSSHSIPLCTVLIDHCTSDPSLNTSFVGVDCCHQTTPVHISRLSAPQVHTMLMSDLQRNTFAFLADVIVGGLIGCLCALLCYHHYYPPLFHFNCHSPYEPNDPESGLHAKSSNVVIS